MVAREFKDAIASQAGHIPHIVFAVYGLRSNRDIFKQVLGS